MQIQCLYCSEKSATLDPFWCIPLACFEEAERDSTGKLYKEQVNYPNLNRCLETFSSSHTDWKGCSAHSVAEQKTANLKHVITDAAKIMSIQLMRFRKDLSKQNHQVTTAFAKFVIMSMTHHKTEVWCASVSTRIPCLSTHLHPGSCTLKSKQVTQCVH